MNKYEIFYRNLKEYLIKNQLQNTNDFKDSSIQEINQISQNLPLAYIEWLKLFGKTEYLLNYPIESYTIEALEYSNNEDTLEFINPKEVKDLTGSELNELLLISNEGSLYIFFEKKDENPITHNIGLNNPFIEKELSKPFKFTTHIKNVIIDLINNQNELNEWFIENITDYDKKPFEKKQSYLELINEIEELEEKENRIFTISEIIKMWNNKKTAYNNV